MVYIDFGGVASAIATYLNRQIFSLRIMVSSTLLLYVFGSVIIVSLVSLVGLASFSIKQKRLEKILLYLVSFAVGALFGDVFIHLLPEAFKESNASLIGIYVLTGILFSFIMEKFIHWRHCHTPLSKQHHHHFAIMNLFGDAMHNFIDGLIIAGAYFVSIPVGIATTTAVLFHEIPHETGNFAVLIYGGFTKLKALFYNFLTALTAVLGALAGVLLSSSTSSFAFLVPFAAGNLIYIAGSDLVPELHKSTCEDFSLKESLFQFIAIALGIGVMMLLLLME